MTKDHATPYVERGKADVFFPTDFNMLGGFLPDALPFLQPLRDMHRKDQAALSKHCSPGLGLWRRTWMVADFCGCVSHNWKVNGVLLERCVSGPYKSSWLFQHIPAKQGDYCWKGIPSCIQRSTDCGATEKSVLERRGMWMTVKMYESSGKRCGAASAGGPLYAPKSPHSLRPHFRGLLAFCHT